MFFKNSSQWLCCSFTFPATTSLYLGGLLILGVSSCNLGAIRRIKHWLKCKMISVPAALVCSAPLWKAEVTTVHPTHFLFSSSTSKFPVPKCQVGIVIRSKRTSHPRKINVVRSGTDLGARTPLSEWSLAASCTGVTILGLNFLKLALKKGKWLFFTGLTVETGLTNGKELCREPEMLWGFALPVQWPW